MAAWIWASKRIEKNFLSKCVEHSARVLKVVEGLTSIIQDLVEERSSNVESTFNDVMGVEREADEMKRSMIYDLSKATLMPLDRDYIIRLILRLDDVADYAKAAARRLLIAKNIGVDLEEVFLSKLIKMASKLREAVELINRALGLINEDLRGVLQIADRIERIEEEADDLRTDILEYVLSKCDEKGPRWCTITKEIVDEVENSIDRCENVADMIRYIAVGLS